MYGRFAVVASMPLFSAASHLRSRRLLWAVHAISVRRPLHHPPPAHRVTPAGDLNAPSNIDQTRHKHVWSTLPSRRHLTLRGLPRPTRDVELLTREAPGRV